MTSEGREVGRVEGGGGLTTVSDMGRGVRGSSGGPAHLEGCWGLIDDFCGLLESSGGSLFTLSGDHLGSCLSRCLCLGGHGSLQLDWQPHVLAVRVDKCGTHLLVTPLHCEIATIRRDRFLQFPLISMFWVLINVQKDMYTSLDFHVYLNFATVLHLTLKRD